MKAIKKLFSAYFLAGVGKNRLDEINRRKFVVNIFSFVGMTVTFLMAVIATINLNWLLASILLVASAVYYYGHYVQRTANKVTLAGNIILYSLYVLMIYLVFSGGSNNTGPLWIFMVAPVSLFMHGLRKGLLDLSVFLIAICALMFYPDNGWLITEYEHDFKTRLIYSFLTVTFLSAFYEYSREESYRHSQDMMEKFEQLARFDPLTNLSNRRDGKEKLAYEYHRMERTNQPVTLLLCDIDYFKKINDTKGHDAGDLVLKSLAELFKDKIRAQDTVIRWGGEEFLFILPQTDLIHASYFASKLHEALAQHYIEYSGDKVSCTMSIGMAQLAIGNEVSEALIAADHELYKAKENGRNQTMPKLAS